TMRNDMTHHGNGHPRGSRVIEGLRLGLKKSLRKSLIMSATALTALALSLTLSTSLSAAEHATITLYHHISETTPDSTSVPPQRFREQMEYLRDDGYHVMGLPQLLEAMRQRQSVPDKTVAITFDDGYISIYDTAFPKIGRAHV